MSKREDIQMKDLHISKEISLPPDAVTETFAFIGRRGSGKTYLATMIAEQMLDISAQVVVVDPVGKWWGLRVDKDGQSKGKEIFVIGGEHGDVPLVPEAGARIAKLVVEKSISVVIDVSRFRLGEYKRFAAEFAEEFFHLKKAHEHPVHLFIEEAQKIIPQRVGPDEARMVGAFEQIVRLGRNYGIGCSLITQRPQSVNKEVLSQVECLCVLQVTGTHERKALDEWVQEVGADRAIVNELPGLSQGEGYVWSPSWLRIYKRVHFSSKQTFDASATPKVGSKVRAAHISAVDVEALKKDMAEVVAQAEKDDPRALRKKIAELEREKTKSGGFQQKIVEKPSKEVIKEVFVIKDGQITRLEKLFEKIIKTAKHFQEDTNLLWGNCASAGDALKKAIESTKRDTKFFVLPSAKVFKLQEKLSIRVGDAMTSSEITGPEQRVLNALAWCESIGYQNPPNEIVSFLSGYSHYRSTGYTNPRGYLKAKGFVDYSAGTVSLTESGRRFAEAPNLPLTQESLHRSVLEKLPNPERRLLTPLLERYPDGISNAELCSIAGYEHERSTGYTNPRGRLRSFGLIDYGSGFVSARPILFINK